LSYAERGLGLDNPKWIVTVLVASASGCELIAGIRDLRFSDVADAQAGPEGSVGDETSASSEAGDAADASSEYTDSSTADANDADAGDSNGSESSSGDSSESGSVDGGPGDSSTTESGALDAARDGSACVGDLSNIGTGDFHISLTVTTARMTRTALVNQRASCATTFCMQPDTFWDIRLLNGALFIETSDSARNCSQVTTNGASSNDGGALVNDGQPHRVIVQRVAQTLTAYIDGVARGSAPSKSSFGQLPPVSKTDPCEATGNTAPFLGSIANLCVTSP
jgi:hypothetical protein